MTMKKAHVLEGDLQYDRNMTRPLSFVTEADYNLLWATHLGEIESAWVLVSYGEQGHEISYLSVHNGDWRWSTDHLHALRLKRRDDAEMVAKLMDHADVEIEQHSWIDSAPSGGAVDA